MRQYDAANTSLDVLLQNESNRYVDVQYDVKSLLSDKTFVRYHLEKDRDYLSSGRDTQKTLNVKRVRAEEKLIKMKIITKIHSGLALSALEKEYLDQWRSNSLVLPSSITNKSFSDISAADAQKLKNLKFSALHEFP